ncbi:caveolin-2-like [Engraulis encrasicolus]|uniref:caveolin-2-like n=1 Tax=Engraulis encrasicolus TaxID=184585 RepID=UPI002FD46B13
MERTESPVAETRIDLEGLEQQLRTELWEQPGVYTDSASASVSGVEEREEEVAMEELVAMGETLLVEAQAEVLAEAVGETQEEVGAPDGAAPVPKEPITPANMRPPMIDRDPRGVNKCLKVNFEDVIAEPPSVRSFDKVWVGSHTMFEVSRLWFYRIISLLLAIPVSLVAGILFAILSCLHIWLIMPCVQLCLINMHWIKVLWASVLDIVIGPLCSSLGKCCGTINIHIAKD